MFDFGPNHLYSLIMQRNLVEIHKYFEKALESEDEIEHLEDEIRNSLSIPYVLNTIFSSIKLHNTDNTEWLTRIISHLLHSLNHNEYETTLEDRNVAKTFLFEELLDINVNLLNKYCSVFRVPTSDKIEIALNLLQTNVRHGMRWIEIENLDLIIGDERILRVLLHGKQYSLADSFVEKSKEKQYTYLKLLEENGSNDKALKKRIEKFEFPLSDFPEFIRRTQKNTLRFLTSMNKYDSIEESTLNDMILKKFTIERLIKSKGMEHIATRYFLTLFQLKDQYPTIEVVPSEKLDEIFTAMMYEDENPSKKENCISLESLNFSMQKVSFIDSIPKYLMAMQNLEKYSIVGVDCEWKSVHSNFVINSSAESEENNLNRNQIKHSNAVKLNNETVPCAILQLACQDAIYVIDMLMFKSTDEFRPLIEFFMNEKILKLGFDISNDLRALKMSIKKQIHAKKLENENTNHKKESIENLWKITRSVLDLKVLTSQLKHEMPCIHESKNSENEDSTPSAIEESSQSQAEDYHSERLPREMLIKLRKEKIRDKRRKKRMAKSKLKGSSSKKLSGLSDVVNDILGLPIDKTVRCSNWERRPLTKAQLHYAALDAYVLIIIYERLSNIKPDLQMKLSSYTYDTA